MASKSEKADVLVRFGENMRKLRNSRGLSQEVLADLCGLDRTYISGIERGRRNLGLRNLDAIAVALDLPMSDLLKGI